MTIYDLVLIGIVLAAAAAVIGVFVQAVSGDLAGAGHTFGVLCWGLAIYVGTVAFVGLTAKQKVLSVGTPSCSDDWCAMPVEACEDGGDVRIVFNVWSRARRAPQREFGVRPFLVDDTGRRYDAYEAKGPGFDRRLQPEESFTTVRLFRVDRDAKRLDLVMRDGFGPDTFVINASQSLFHKRTVYRIKE